MVLPKLRNAQALVDVELDKRDVVFENERDYNAMARQKQSRELESRKSNK